jgi:multidrug resistance efflux pump
MSADASAQQAEVAEAEARLEHARIELRRFSKLRDTDDVTASEFNARQNAVQVLEHTVAAARDRLRSLSEVRPDDVRSHKPSWTQPSSASRKPAPRSIPRSSTRRWRAAF